MAVVAIGRGVGNALLAITATRAIGAAVSADEAVAVEAGPRAGYARQVGGGQRRGARGEALAIDGEEELVDVEEENEESTRSVVTTHLWGGMAV